MKKIIIAIVVIVLIILGITLFLPADINVERTAEIAAPAATVFSQVNDLKAWEKWDPWHAKEPEMGGSTYSDNSSGKGALHCWDSENPDIGKGCMAISESEENASIKTALQFEGMDSEFGGFTFNESDGVTTVTWNMEMHVGLNPIGRIMGLFMDGMVGPDFETGLSRLKELCEAMPAYPIEIADVTLKDQPICSITDSATTFEIGAKLGQLFGEISAHIAASGGEPAGQPLCIWHKYDPGGYNRLEAAIPLKEAVAGTERVKAGMIPSSKAVMGIHVGAYGDAAPSYMAIDAYIADHGYQKDGPPWEVYVTDPGTVKDTSQWITHIYYRVAE